MSEEKKINFKNIKDRRNTDIKAESIQNLLFLLFQYFLMRSLIS
tara:strand:- start:286 stop:417 length:132 start_codon:yes stop_codon:yes gene_type:complete